MGACVFSCSLPSVLLAEWVGFSTCYCSNMDTVSLHLKPHTWVHVCLVVACRLCFWQNEWGFQHATAVTWMWTGHQSKSAQKVDHGGNKSAPVGTWTCDLLIMSLAPYHWAIPTPHDNYIHGMFYVLLCLLLTNEFPQGGNKVVLYIPPKQFFLSLIHTVSV